MIVAGAVDTRGKYANRVRLKVIPNGTSETLIEFVKANVKGGSSVKNRRMGWLFQARSIGLQACSFH